MVLSKKHVHNSLSLRFGKQRKEGLSSLHFQATRYGWKSAGLKEHEMSSSALHTLEEKSPAPIYTVSVR